MNTLKVAVMGDTYEQSRYWLREIREHEDCGVLVYSSVDRLIYTNDNYNFIEYLVVKNDFSRNRGCLVDQFLICGSLGHIDKCSGSPVVNNDTNEILLYHLRRSCVPEEFKVQYLDLEKE